MMYCQTTDFQLLPKDLSLVCDYNKDTGSSDFQPVGIRCECSDVWLVVLDEQLIRNIKLL